jgi:hypothetical protein
VLRGGPYLGHDIRSRTGHRSRTRLFYCRDRKAQAR